MGLAYLWWIALIPGILFWTDRTAESLVQVHLVLGILVVAQALTRGGSWSLAIGAVVFGLILPASGDPGRATHGLVAPGHPGNAPGATVSQSRAWESGLVAAPGAAECQP